MLKTIALVVGVMIASSPAFATRARLEALGEGKNGSYYVKDNRNVFLNPAQINNFKKQITFELGADATTSDSAASPVGQGGFHNTFGDFTYGIYLGNDSDTTKSFVSSFNGSLGQAGAGGPDLIAPNSTVDAFFGGDAGVKWGVNLFYAGGENNVGGPTDAAPTQTASQFGTRLGVELDNLAIFTTVAIATKAKAVGDTTENEFKGKIGINAGITYSMDDFTFFGKFATTGADWNSGSVGATTKVAEVSVVTYGLGFGYQKEMVKGVSLFARSGVDISQTVTKNGTGVETSKVSAWNVPLVIGAEGEAASWLDLRAAVSQSLVGQNLSGGANRDSFNNTRTVSVGSTFKLGAINVDAVIAGGTAPTVNGNPGTSGQPGTDGTFGFGKEMLYRIGMTYNM